MQTSTTTQPVAPRLLLDAREAAAALSISPRTLWSLTSPRGPIPAVRIGARCLYAVKSLQGWIDAQAGDARADGADGKAEP
jgi:hypothetical protein